MAKLFLKALLSIFLMYCSLVQAKVVFVEVETNGTGMSYQEAVAGALIQAVEQVNGVSISGKEEISQLSSVVQLNDDESSSFQEIQRKKIEKATKGAVSKYEVLDSSNNGSGLWDVSLLVSVAKFKVSSQANRLRLAIMRFSAVESNAFSAQLVEKITALLTQTRKFAVLDRDYQYETDSELYAVKTDNYATEELAKLGNRLSADYLVVGKIQDQIISPRTITLKSSGKKVYVTDYKANISYRIIDVATGQVKFADIYSTSYMKNGKAQNVEHLVNKSANRIGRKIINAIYPVMVESAQGDYLYLGQGQGLLEVGDIYTLVKLGAEIKDSYTGESLGKEEIEVGTVKIVDVQAKISKASIVNSKIDVISTFEKRAYLVRPIETTNRQKVSIKKVAKTIENEFEDFYKENDSNW